MAPPSNKPLAAPRPAFHPQSSMPGSPSSQPGSPGTPMTSMSDFSQGGTPPAGRSGYFAPPHQAALQSPDVGQGYSPYGSSPSEGFPGTPFDSQAGGYSAGGYATGVAAPHMPAARSWTPAGSDAGASSTGKLRQRQKPFQSQRLDRSVPVHKPWLTGPGSKKHRLSYFLTLAGIFIGLAVGAYLIYTGFAQVPKNNYCQVLGDSFSGTALDESVWQREVIAGGNDVDDFVWYTNDAANSFVSNGNLWIVPTFTNESSFGSDLSQSLDIGNDCTASDSSQCSVSGSDASYIPPVQSASITTRGKTTIKYGRVEVTARMPTGDWIWPRISLVPADDVYGPYPASGLIDIFNSRGNIASKRKDQLNNVMGSGLHWGPDPTLDKFSLTQGLYKVYRMFFNDEYYTFGVDWDDKQIFIWINSRARKALNLNFKSKTFFKRGSFPASYGNGTIVQNPWINSGNQFIAPFDQEFYLRMQVSAGGLDGYWADDLEGKPWQNTNTRGGAMKSFWDQASTWTGTWPTDTAKRALAIQDVKMWKLGKC